MSTLCSRFRLDFCSMSRHDGFEESTMRPITARRTVRGGLTMGQMREEHA
jgi:hypothetical protein